MKSFWIALAMYSKLPARRVEWDKKSLSWALCWFPAVGVAAGALLFFWLWLAQALGLGAPLRAAIALLIPVAVSGGIHLDGLCDPPHALGSNQTREKKLEILKDSHTGAFAVFCCGLYLILFFAAWCQAETASLRSAGAMALTPVLSRSLSGLAAVTQPNARGSGLLATFTAPMDCAKARVVLAVWIGVCAIAMVCLSPWAGGAAVLAAAGSFFYYIAMSRRQFGGITGDLAGYFIQVCECAGVLLAALAQRAEVLL